MRNAASTQAADRSLAIRLFQRGDMAGSEIAFREYIARRPDDHEALNGLGGLLRRLGRLQDAAELFRRALGVQPAYWDARYNLANTLLALGDVEGWSLYDERPERVKSEANKLGFPEWRGEPLHGKRLFVWTEQGFGDQILAARYLARTGAQSVTAVCHPPLVRLLSQLPVSIMERRPQTAVVPHDYWTLPLSLPRWCGGELSPGAYLAAQPCGRAGIGVAWRGNALPDPGRSIPDEIARPLLALPGALSLHPEDTGAIDFQATAEIIAGLDLIITIDTSIAHLAGAMGKSVFLLLQEHSHDWRWERPWYPNIRTFRQTRQGDWQSAVAKACATIYDDLMRTSQMTT